MSLIREQQRIHPSSIRNNSGAVYRSKIIISLPSLVPHVVHHTTITPILL